MTQNLLLLEAEEPHVGSIDVDLALDAEKLNNDRYCLDNVPGGMESLAANWKIRKEEVDVARAIEILFQQKLMTGWRGSAR